MNQDACIATEDMSVMIKILRQFDEQGKRLSEALNRIDRLGARLENNVPMDKGNQKETPQPGLPGIATDYTNCVNQYDMVITQIEYGLNKIEKFI